MWSVGTFESSPDTYSLMDAFRVVVQTLDLIEELANCDDDASNWIIIQNGIYVWHRISESPNTRVKYLHLLIEKMADTLQLIEDVSNTQDFLQFLLFVLDFLQDLSCRFDGPGEVYPRRFKRRVEPVVEFGLPFSLSMLA